MDSGTRSAIGFCSRQFWFIIELNLLVLPKLSYTCFEFVEIICINNIIWQTAPTSMYSQYASFTRAKKLKCMY